MSPRFSFIVRVTAQTYRESGSHTVFWVVLPEERKQQGLIDLQSVLYISRRYGMGTLDEQLEKFAA
ncbi:MAG TPA: hypothetical protein VK579_03900 [Terriglobales bacterium]|nr:hypothetical protein [Terriglobales bacterium]